MELIKERFAKLLLGEDMSGTGKGVSSALALSNAITNLAGILIVGISSRNYVIQPILSYETQNLFIVCVLCAVCFWLASVFGEQSRLEPMPPERKARWTKEIDWLLSVTDHIVEFVASQQGNMEVTFCLFFFKCSIPFRCIYF